jgi:hypothetical protein
MNILLIYFEMLYSNIELLIKQLQYIIKNIDMLNSLTQSSCFNINTEESTEDFIDETHILFNFLDVDLNFPCIESSNTNQSTDSFTNVFNNSRVPNNVMEIFFTNPAKTI